MTNRDLAKYFWSLNKATLKKTAAILKDPDDRRFPERMVVFLSRCNKPKDLFSLISKQEFAKSWPRIKAYWKKVARMSYFRNWWQTVYEQILESDKTKQARPNGKPAAAFVRMGKYIREARVRKGLSQRDLAGKVMMKQPDISMIEGGKKNITMGTLIRLCLILGIEKIEIGDKIGE